MSHDPYAALRHREYRWFLVGSAAIFIGTQLQTVVMGWQVFALTHDPLSLGLIGLSEAVPFLSLTLVGGLAADRFDRRFLALASGAVLISAALALLVYNWQSVGQVWPFYLAQGVAGTARAFYRPASSALGTELVPREIYANATTWRSSTMQLVMVTGPALGGLLYGFGSARLAYGVEVALMALGLGSLGFVRARPRVALKVERIGRGLSEGVRFVFSRPVLLGALGLDLFAVLFGGAPALLPAFAAQVLHTGPQGLGVLRAAPALGSLAVSVMLVYRPPTRRAGVVLFLCVAGFGLCWVAFAFSTGFVLSLFLLALSGALDNVSVVLRQTLLQMLTPQEMMGRVSAVNSFFIGSSNELGAFESGVMARVLGLVPSVVFGGLMTLGVVAVTAWRVPELRRLKQVKDVSTI